MPATPTPTTAAKSDTRHRRPVRRLQPAKTGETRRRQDQVVRRSVLARPLAAQRPDLGVQSLTVGFALHRRRSLRYRPTSDARPRGDSYHSSSSSVALRVACALLAPASRFADDAPPTAEQLDGREEGVRRGQGAPRQGQARRRGREVQGVVPALEEPAAALQHRASRWTRRATKDLALFYYRKFLTDAPADAAQRATVTERVKALEQEKLEADLNGKPDRAASQARPSRSQARRRPSPRSSRPARTAPTDFQHQVVEEAPPGKPLDITAFVPEDSGFVVTLYYRGAGERNVHREADEVALQGAGRAHPGCRR